MWALQRFAPEQRQLFLRFWKSASGFWRGRAAWIAWSLTISLIVVVLLQLFIQYELNCGTATFSMRSDGGIHAICGDRC